MTPKLYPTLNLMMIMMNIYPVYNHSSQVVSKNLFTTHNKQSLHMYTQPVDVL